MHPNHHPARPITPASRLPLLAATVATALATTLVAPFGPATANAAPPARRAAPTPVSTPVSAIAPDAARPLATRDWWPLEARVLEALRSGVASQTIAIDLPRLGVVTLELSRTATTTEDFVLELARVEKGATVSASAEPVLPIAYTGRIAGFPASRVYLGVGTGEGAGIVAGTIALDPHAADPAGTDTWWISSGPLAARRAGLPPMIAHARGLAGQPVDGLRCAAGELAGGTGTANAGEGGVAGGTACREFRLAIDTDTEYTMAAHGGNAVAASQYALLLLGAASQVYDRDLDAKLPVRYLRLWTGEDIWTGADMFEQLTQYRDHWASTMGAVPRDLGHYLAGRGLGGGVAWLGVVCTGNDWSYALSSGIGYGFPYPLVDHDHGNWEPMVVNHEIGHNFGAPHTHDHTPQADGCGTGDCSQAWTGTIMSYCHGCDGGMSNVSLVFHPYSIASMQGHLGNVGCSDAGATAVDDAVSTLEGVAVTVTPLSNDAFVNCSAATVLSFDTASVAGGTVTSIGGGPGATILAYTPPAGFSGTDSFGYTIVDATGATSTATVRVTVREILDSLRVVDDLPGVVAKWYELAGSPAVLPDFATLAPYGEAILGNINIPSTGGNFSSSGRADLIGAVFEGYLRIPTSGVWKLSSESDDGSRLWVDGVLLVENDGLHGMVDRTGEIALEAGLHRVRVEFFENGGGAGLVVRWEGPGISRKIIPAGLFRHGGTEYAVDLDGDGTVGAGDLAVVLGAWGAAPAGTAADLDRNGTVDAGDLGILLSFWGS